MGYIYVGNIPETCSQHDILELFQDFKPGNLVLVAEERHAFVEVEDPDLAVQKLHHASPWGRGLMVGRLAGPLPYKYQVLPQSIH